MRLAGVGALCLFVLLVAHGAAVGFPLLAQNWQEYSPGERYEALRNYRRHQKLPRRDQQEVERQYQRWQNLEPDKRARIRENYERYRSLPPGEQDQFERRYRSWKRQQEPARTP
ncbi:MAG: hypothetical protein A3J75_03490 [Acidobacteria bacterium RBG_16_68_9]|nr:MAG: hypothetical protein A3J75_03490 [Acidobacteria bacterium RBG_16_68_9]